MSFVFLHKWRWIGTIFFDVKTYEISRNLGLLQNGWTGPKKKFLNLWKMNYIYIYIKGQNGTVARNIFFEVNIYIKEVM
jgi:hypothetical protein